MDIWEQAPAPLGLCHTPEKKKYPDRVGAWRAVERLREIGYKSGVYICKCGWWHLTSKGYRNDRPAIPRPIPRKGRTTRHGYDLGPGEDL